MMGLCEAKDSAGSTWTCPECAQMNQWAAKLCPICLNPRPAGEGAAVAQNKPKTAPEKRKRTQKLPGIRTRESKNSGCVSQECDRSHGSIGENLAENRKGPSKRANRQQSNVLRHAKRLRKLQEDESSKSSTTLGDSKPSSILNKPSLSCAEESLDVSKAVESSHCRDKTPTAEVLGESSVYTPSPSPEDAGQEKLGIKKSTMGAKRELTPSVQSDQGRPRSSKNPREPSKSLFSPRDCPTTPITKASSSVRPRPPACGFTTGSGRTVNISPGSLLKARQKFQDSSYESSSNDSPGGSGKAVNKSANNIQKTKQSICKGYASQSSRPKPCGFTTGSGKAVRVSARSLAKATRKLQVANTPSNSPTIDEAKARVQANSSKPGRPPPCGFTTGSGRSIKISANSMKKAEQKLKVTATRSSRTLTCELTSGSEKVNAKLRGTLATMKSRRPEKADTPRSIKEEKEKLGGFNQSLKRTKAKLQENSPKCLAPCGFMTGSGKAVKISAQSLKRAAAKLQESFPDCPAPCGFTTGSGKSVNISAQSLKKAKAKLQESSSTCPSPCGFMTGSGEPVKISAQSLEMAQAKMQESLDAETTFHSQALCKDTKSTLHPSGSTSTRKRSAATSERRRPNEKRLRSEADGCTPRPTPNSRGFLTPAGNPLRKPRTKNARKTPRTPLQTITPVQMNRKRSAFPRTPTLTSPAQTPVATPRAILGPRLGKYTPSPRKLSPFHRSKAFKAPQSARRPKSKPFKPPRRVLKPLSAVKKAQKKIKTTLGLEASFAYSGKLKLREFFRPSRQSLQTTQHSPADSVTSENAALFTFQTHGKRLGSSEAWQELLVWSEDPIGCTKEWVANHYRWIVWKLASYHRKFGVKMKDSSLRFSFSSVISQLKLRYRKEVLNAKRSAIKKFLEGDDSPSRYMVLCVSKMCGESDSKTIEVTDGWYAIECEVDDFLWKCVQDGKIYPGLKLRIFGAVLVNNSGPVAPLENTTTKLKINVNSTRRAPWDARLGNQARPAFRVSISSLKPYGGVLPMLRVRVVKQYPIMTYERKNEGRGYRRNQNAEFEARIRFEKAYKRRVADFIQKNEKSFASPEELKQGLEKYIQESDSLHRKTSSYFKVEIEDFGRTSRAVLVIWVRHQDIRDSFRPGNVVELFGVGVRQLTARGPELTTNRLFAFKILQKDQSINHKFTTLGELAVLQPGDNFDVVGVVVAVGDKQHMGSSTRRVIFVADASHEILGISMVENDECKFLTRVPSPGQLLVIENLKYAGFTKSLKVHNADTAKETLMTTKPRPGKQWSFLEWFQETDTGKVIMSEKMGQALKILHGEVSAPAMERVESVPRSVVACGIISINDFDMRKNLTVNMRMLERDMKASSQLLRLLAKAKFSYFLKLDSSTHSWPLLFNASTFRRLLESLDLTDLEAFIQGLVSSTTSSTRAQFFRDWVGDSSKCSCAELL
ncbi:hypothetical protein AAMO2058_000887100 [Amorphochlora amoebiformis]